MIIDFHTHCFPDRLAGRAIESLRRGSGGMNTTYDGTVNGLLRRMDESGVDVSVVLSIATNARQQHSVNDFAASIHNDRLIPFGSVHPDAPDALDELERIAAMGLRGVKFHPDYQEFYVDEPRMKPIYEKISSLGLITVFHSGYDVGFLGRHCSPKRLRNALEWFNGATVIAAHFGGWASFDEVLETLCGQPVYFDISLGCGHVPRPYAKEIIKKHGAGKILFATDGPWQSAEDQIDFLNTLELSDSELDMIYSGNALKLLGQQVFCPADVKQKP
ncbi:MAG: amidohydrolase family protein [Clostridia bacterium]|nr:amidohydrolase family protein [Clostridia bacterium]